jgi:general secretion pathway protein G
MLARVVKLFRDNRGFTLIEMIVVVIILGLLAGLVAPKLFGRVGQSKQVAARTQIELLGAALDQYSLDMGSYPTSLDALIRSPGSGGNWNGPYLKKNTIPSDPWGNPYNYKCCPGEHGDYDLWSDGADGRPGGTGESADVASWTIK